MNCHSHKTFPNGSNYKKTGRVSFDRKSNDVRNDNNQQKNNSTKTSKKIWCYPCQELDHYARECNSKCICPHELRLPENSTGLMN